MLPSQGIKIYTMCVAESRPFSHTLGSVKQVGKSTMTPPVTLPATQSRSSSSQVTLTLIVLAYITWFIDIMITCVCCAGKWTNLPALCWHRQSLSYINHELPLNLRFSLCLLTPDKEATDEDLLKWLLAQVVNQRERWHNAGFNESSPVYGPRVPGGARVSTTNFLFMREVNFLRCQWRGKKKKKTTPARWRSMVIVARGRPWENKQLKLPVMVIAFNCQFDLL